jgi:hypothetical protein
MASLSYVAVHADQLEPFWNRGGLIALPSDSIRVLADAPSAPVAADPSPALVDAFLSPIWSVAGPCRAGELVTRRPFRALSVASRSLPDCPSPVRWLGGGSAPRCAEPGAPLPGRFAASYTAAMRLCRRGHWAGTRRSRPVAGDKKHALERLHSRLARRGYETRDRECF